MFRELSRPIALPADTDDWFFLVSYKFDGVRFSYQDGEVYSRSGKPIRNRHICNAIKNADLPDGIDGELISGKNFQETTSAVMSSDGEPDFKAIIFDILPSETTSNVKNLERILRLAELPHFRDYILDDDKKVVCESPTMPWLQLAYHGLCDTKFGVDGYIIKAKELGLEGIVLRRPGILYYDKMYKVKFDKSAEATVIDLQQLVRKDGSLADQCGALIVKNHEYDVTFKIGTGFLKKDRIKFWEDRETLIGKIVNYRYDYLSTNNIPRFPRYAGIRHKDDLLPM